MNVYATLSTDSSRGLANLIVDYIGDNQKLFNDVFYLSLKSPSPVNWRGIRALFLCADKQPHLIIPLGNDIVSELKKEHKPPVVRGLLRMLTVNVAAELHHLFGFLLEYCYKKISAAYEEVAIKVYALEIIYQITAFEPGLKQELQIVLEDVLLEEMKPAFQAKGKKIMRKLEKELSTPSSYL